MRCALQHVLQRCGYFLATLLQRSPRCTSYVWHLTALQQHVGGHVGAVRALACCRRNLLLLTLLLQRRKLACCRRNVLLPTHVLQLTCCCA